jgi:phosphatidylinositol kinase/protein kinase (PI-3  family)
LYLETISKGNEHLGCFDNNPQQVLQEMCERFFPHMNDHAAENMIHTLINQSLDHWTTNAYDQYQRLCQGIF